jgi:hypothetical protein
MRSDNLLMLLALASLPMAAGGCTTASQPELERSGSTAGSTVVPSDAPTRLPRLSGYVHDHDRSKFAKGALRASRSELGSDRFVGEHGVFAFRPMTGLSVGIPNGNSPIAARPRLAGGPDDHNNAVRLYFTRGGLPDEQVAKVDALARMTQSYDNGTANKPELVCWNSLLRRHSGGIAIKESYAWARFNVDGQVVAESVHWPELPGSVIADAAELSAVAKAPVHLAALQAKLPADLQTVPGEVVIHHTPGEWAGPFVAMATFDVARNNRLLHFDKNGVEVKLPNEMPDAYGVPPPTSK